MLILDLLFLSLLTFNFLQNRLYLTTIPQFILFATLELISIKFKKTNKPSRYRTFKVFSKLFIKMERANRFLSTRSNVSFISCVTSRTKTMAITRKNRVFTPIDTVFFCFN